MIIIVIIITKYKGEAMKDYKKTFIINVDIDEENLNFDFINSHCDNWKNEESPTKEELTNSFKNECESWLNALGFGIEFVEPKGE
tara:strand:- start:216 stop:470 length:255 start_codon:yes stop_codon:yes gene_type:complete